jgi:beta-glucosidase
VTAADLARRFPAGFEWGAATSAFQIEGAADERAPTIWDTFGPPAGAACDHVHRYRDDVELLASLGLTAYRFSLSGTRDLDFYDRLVDALLEQRIRPLATVFHWDLPLAVHERGGWVSGAAGEWLATRAGEAARRLGDRVHDWLTLNEPAVHAFLGYAEGRHAPGERDRDLAVRVAHAQLLAHREAAAAIRAAAPGARVGIALDLRPQHAADDSAADAVEAADARANRWFLDPLFGRGYPVAGWPVGDDLAAELEGYDGDLDLLGVNYYTREVVGPAGPLPPREPLTDMGWEIHPEGLTEILLRIARDYRPLPLLVTENGTALGEGVEDEGRRVYLERHVGAVADALAAGAPVQGYFAWSLLDNYEWDRGFDMRFGIVHVDYATQARTARASGRWYASLVDEWRRFHGA